MSELLVEAPAFRESWDRQISRTRWAHRTPTLQGLSLRFGVRSTDPRLGRYVDSLLASLQVPVPAAHWYSLVTHRGGFVDLFLDNTLVNHHADAGEAVEWLLWDINRAVAEASDEHLLFHAGGVRARDGGVLIPGASGSGKTTLVAALVRSGLGYLSDEVVAVTPSGATLLPYPKALVVKSGSFDVLRDLEPKRALQPVDSPVPNDSREQWYLTPSEIRAGAVARACGARLVVFPNYGSGAATQLRHLGASEAFISLATNTVNLPRHGYAGIELLKELVDNCDCYELAYSDVESACKMILGLLEEKV